MLFNQDYKENTFCSELEYGFNYNDIPIPIDFSGKLHTESGTSTVQWFDFSTSFLIPEYFVSLVASISRGNVDPHNVNMNLYYKLIQWGYESPFEFVHIPEVYYFNGGLRNEYGVNLYKFPDYIISLYTKDEIIKLIYMQLQSKFTVLLEIPIVVATQIVRHRRATYMEKSSTFTIFQKEELINQDIVENYILAKCKDDNTRSELKQELDQFYDQLYNLYHKMIHDYKMNRYVARMLLPLGTKTVLWMQSDVYGWANFFALRLSNEAFELTREIAETILELALSYQPDFVRELYHFYRSTVYSSLTNPSLRRIRKERAEFMIEYIENSMKIRVS